MNNINNKKKLIYFIITIIISSGILFFIFHAAFFGSFIPRYFQLEKSIQHFHKEDLFHEIYGFNILNNGTIISESYDPQIYLPINSKIPGDILTINISNLNPSSTSAQIFYIREGEYFNESDSIRFILKNGNNVLHFPYSGITQLRLDLAEEPDVSMIVNEVILSNYIKISGKFLFTFFLFLLIIILCSYIYFFKREKLYVLLDRAKVYFIDKNTSEYLKPKYFLDYFKLGNPYWISVVITAILCYGFTLTNHSIGMDTELLIFKDYPSADLLRQGRWGFFLLSLLPIDIFQFVNFWSNFITLILFIISSTLCINLYKRYSNGYFSNTAGIIFSCMSISLPYIATRFFYIGGNIPNGISHILILICAYLTLGFDHENKKTILNKIISLLICILVLTFCISLYEHSLSKYLILLYSFIFLLFITSNNNNFDKMKILISRTLITIFICGISIILWRVIGKGVQNITGLEPYGYVLDSYMKYDFNSISAFINSIKYSFINLITNIFSFNNIYSNNLIITSRIIILISVLFFTIIKRQASVFLAGILLLLSSISLEIVSNNYDLLSRIKYYTANFVAFSFALLYILFNKITIKTFKIKSIISVIIILIILNSSLWMNKIFYEHYSAYQYRLGVMRSISNDLLKYDQYKPVGFIGELPVKKILDTSIYDITHLNYSNLFPMLRANLSIYAFFANHGYRLYGFDSNKFMGVSMPYGFLSKLEIEDFNSMPSYPNDGYILETDEYIIVKIGSLNK